MKCIRQVILLMGLAPDGERLANRAEVNWLAGALWHLAPAAITIPAEVAADIADDHAGIWTLILIAHDLHPCIMKPTAQRCAVDWMISFRLAERRLLRSVLSATRHSHKPIVAYIAEESSASLCKYYNIPSNYLYNMHK